MESEGSKAEEADGALVVETVLLAKELVDKERIGLTRVGGESL